MTTPFSADIVEVFGPSVAVVAVAVAVLPNIPRDNALARGVALGICAVLSWRYMFWRLFDTLPEPGLTLDFLVGALFVGVELLCMINSSASMVFLSRVRSRSKDVDAAIPWLLERAPLIDVLICTYNEEQAILERTLIGAVAMSYPNYRVWVCDDGRRDWLRDLCADYGVGYLTRADNSHAKAGNINSALKHLAALPQRPEFVSILDADFIPSRHFLTRAGALMRDDDVGVVQTPQHFFNPDPIQHNLHITRVWPDEQRFFFEAIMASKDAWGAAFCCGTSVILRFAPLWEIGGFPTDSVTEDYLVTLRLRQKGFRTIYLNEPLSLGLAPESLAEYCGQRSRWCLGFIQICKGPSGPLKPGNGLKLIDRLTLIETFIHWTASYFFRILALVVPALYLLFDIQAVHAELGDAASHIAPFVLAHCAVLLWLTQGRVLPLMSELYQLLCAVDVLSAAIAGMRNPERQKFRVTAKGMERDKRQVQWPVLRIFLFFLLLATISVARAFLFRDTTSLPDSAAMALFWSWYNFIVIILACYCCIERPQRRDGERFLTNVPVVVAIDGARSRFHAANISISGVKLIGVAPAAVGSKARVIIDDFEVDAQISRATDACFALRFDASPKARSKAIRHVFSGRYALNRPEAEPARVMRAILARVMR